MCLCDAAQTRRIVDTVCYLLELFILYMCMLLKLRSTAVLHCRYIRANATVVGMLLAAQSLRTRDILVGAST